MSFTLGDVSFLEQAACGIGDVPKIDEALAVGTIERLVDDVGLGLLRERQDISLHGGVDRLQAERLGQARHLRLGRANRDLDHARRHVTADLGLRPGVEAFAVVEQDHLVGDRLDLVDVLRGDDGRHRRLQRGGDGGQVAQKLLSRHHVEIGERLIQHEQSRRRDQGPHQLEPDLVPTGNLVPGGILILGEPIALHVPVDQLAVAPALIPCLAAT